MRLKLTLEPVHISYGCFRCDTTEALARAQRNKSISEPGSYYDKVHRLHQALQQFVRALYPQYGGLRRSLNTSKDS